MQNTGKTAMLALFRFPQLLGNKVQLNPITTSHLYLILRENSVHNINQPIFLASRFQTSLLHALLPIANPIA